MAVDFSEWKFSVGEPDRSRSLRQELNSFLADAHARLRQLKINFEHHKTVLETTTREPTPASLQSDSEPTSEGKETAEMT